MSSTLARAWLSAEARDARIPRHPEFATDAAGVIEPFELAGPRDYLNRHGEPREIAR
jgi:hypothetical protein